MKYIRHNTRAISILMIVLFSTLVVYGMVMLSTQGNRFVSSFYNTYVRQKKEEVQKGSISDKNDIVLAHSAMEGEHIKRFYHDDPLLRQAVVHVVGDEAGYVAHGMEGFMASYLYGLQDSLLNRWGNFFRGEKPEGHDLQLTIDATLCKEIATLVRQNPHLQNKKGAVVVMNYETGAVEASMSFPLFDPYMVDELKQDKGKPFFNRATQGMYTPGSTFKIVTAAAALQQDALKNTSFLCGGQLKIHEDDTNFITDAGTNLQKNKIVSHGQLSLQEAFTVSCNNSFAQIALMLRHHNLSTVAEHFGFNENFLFRDVVVKISTFPANMTPWELAWAGAGQSTALMTPMHLCLIVSAIANDGVMMEPRLLKTVTTQNGKEILHFSAKPYCTLFREEPEIIEQLQAFLYSVVNDKNGTGQAASLTFPKVYGKTGTAEVTGQEDSALFVGYLDSEKTPYALSIIFKDAGSGGSVAAPLAQDIFQALLERE